MKGWLLAGLLLFVSLPGESCTSVIISGRLRPDGRPVMMKHRDTQHTYNHIEYRKGKKYRFIGLVNSDRPGGRSVWGGTNEKGFCIMNTASYNMYEATDGITKKQMDAEGVLMALALGCCADRADFEHFLDTLSRPMKVETNFGIIDAKGAAVYYEVSNYAWKPYDVGDPAVAQKGWLVRTNYSVRGRAEERRGVERFQVAQAVLEEAGDKVYEWGHTELIEGISRCYRHSVLGYDLRKDFSSMVNSGLVSGVFPDLDYIPRKSTGSVMVFEGVKAGENPLNTVMWTLLGYPACSVAFPLVVGDSDRLPDYVKIADPKQDRYCFAHRYSQLIRNRHIFRFRTGKECWNYMDLTAVMEGCEGAPSLLECCRKAEDRIQADMDALRANYAGKTHTKKFFQEYARHSKQYMDWVKTVFQEYRK